MNKRVCVLGAIALLAATGLAPAIAQQPALGDFWTPLPARPTIEDARSGQEQWLVLDEVGLQRHLDLLPEAGSDGSLPLTLPQPDGTLARFEVSRSLVMAPELAAKYPQIQTFQAVAVDGSATQVRFELGPRGFSAMQFSPGGVKLIERGSAGADYVSFAREGARSGAPFQCAVGDQQPSPETAAAKLDAASAPAPKAVGPTLRTYRTAVAATGEYTATFGGTVVGGLAGVVSAINRVNQIYETELGLRLVLVPNNDLVIYTDGNTDPYTNSNGSTMLGQNATNLANVIGNANFDFGHVFSTGGGGVAGLGVICGGSKARGVTGQGNPVNDPFWVDYVAHEMGHQLNGPHTFNGGTSSCSGNRSSAAAFEVGSGSTIMAYAGICGGENTQANSDPYFHVSSLQTIHQFTQSGNGSTCGTTSPTGNAAPLLTATPGATIPARTPFALTANATDPNGDRLSYLWEQMDLGAATNTTTVLQDLGSGPLFRSFDATDSPTRLFPRLENILSGTATIGEVLPTTNRTINFRVTARDNRAGGGGVQWTGTSSPSVAQTTITVVNTGTPFAVTTANAATSWNAGSTQPVTWDVAGTTAAPISCPNVDIDFSLDRGLSFPYSLVAATANDGSEDISVPNQATAAGRLRVRCSNNIFFDINNADITVTGGNAAPQLALSGGAVSYTSNGPAVLIDAAATISDADSANFEGGELRLELTNNGEANDRLQLRAQGDGPGQVDIDDSNVEVGGTVVGTFEGGVGLQPLVVQFNAASTPAAAQAVLRAATYGNTRDIAGTLPRTLRASISDGDGGASPGATRLITIQLSPDPFLYRITSNLSGNSVQQGEPVLYTLTFSRPINLASVSAVDFDNAGTSSITIGSISQPQPGILQVQVTATSMGTLRLRLPASAVILDSSNVPVPVPFVHEVTYTVTAPDTTAPLLTGFSNDATGGTVAARIAVTYVLSFNEPIAIGGLPPTSFSNAGSGAITVSGIALASPTSLRVVVTPLASGTLTLRLSGPGVTDIAGNPLSVPITDPATLTVTPASAVIFVGSFGDN